MRGWARAHGITLVGGSITERREGREKLSNTCVVFDPDGEIAAVYRKIHLFDVEVGGFVYRESDAEEPGDEPVVAEVEGWPVGLTVCYDVRFPELYRILALEGALLSPCRRTSRSTRARTTGSCCCARGRSRTSATWPRRPRSARRCPGRQSFGRVVDRRSLGHRARAGAGRGDGDLGRARPRAAGGDPRALPVAREPPPEAYRWPSTV